MNQWVELTALISILSAIMFGEAGVLHDDTSAKMVGHIYMNRYISSKFYDPYDERSREVQAAGGFCAYPLIFGKGTVPNHYIELAHDVYVEHKVMGLDPSDGCFWVTSWDDVSSLAYIYAPYYRYNAEWKSPRRVLDGVVYQLYVFREWDFSRPDFDYDYEGLLKSLDIVPLEEW